MITMIEVTLPDGSKKSVKPGSTVLDVAKEIGPRLAQAALVAKVDGKLVDLSHKLQKGCSLQILTFKDAEAVDVFRHSTAHIMADAVLRLFPYAKLTIGPVVPEGFYYDFDHKPFTPEDLQKIEKKMAEIVKEDLPFERKELSKKEALGMFKDNEYKIEIINELPKGEVISAYRHGAFIDLCHGPHIPSTGRVKALKLLKVAGAYWRGDQKNKQLQRVYGISFPEKKDLDGYLLMMEEAEKRDHRKIGKELDLFMFSDIAPGAPFFLPKGAIIYNELLAFLREEYRKRGYLEVITPLVYDKSLWETSGHWEHYQENMFLLKVDGKDASLKPMNCPSHQLMYKNQTRSYRELPLRIADFAVLHRNELKGVLGGLTRVRKFQQDDAHIFVAPEQIEDEVINVLDFTHYVYQKIFDFPLHIKLSTKPGQSMGSQEQWDLAEKALANALKKKKIQYEVAPGEGAFYGPKIDVHVKDALGRSWQLATIQVDFQQPMRFGLEYEGKDGKKHTPIIIHRAILGAFERFIGVLVEHYAGKFPLWLSPVQVIVLPIADRHVPYAQRVKQMLFDKGIRVEVDARSESTPKKVREAQLQKIPYILVVGDKEEQNSTVNVRTRDNVVHGEQSTASFADNVLKEIREKKREV